LTLARIVVFAITPAPLARLRIELVLVNALSQSTASCLSDDVTGTARLEPPRKVGMTLPGMWLGIGYAPSCGARSGFPVLGSMMPPHSQPLPIIDATCPCAKTWSCVSSLPVRSARDDARTSVLSRVSAFWEMLESSEPTHLPFLNRAIAPP
jgi:hypothetical protein